jgi:hypothetical protein
VAATSPPIEQPQAQKVEPIAARPASAPPWELQAISTAWAAWAATQGSDLASKLVSLTPVGLEGSEILVMEPVAGYNWLVDLIERTDFRAKIENNLRQWLDRRVVLQFRKLEEPTNGSAGRHSPGASRDDRLLDEPLHKLIVERFEAKTILIEDVAEENGQP